MEKQSQGVYRLMTMPPTKKFDGQRLCVDSEMELSEEVQAKSHSSLQDQRKQFARWTDATDDCDTAITVNTTIRLKDLQNGTTRTCTIADPELAPTVPGGISVLHPLGNRLIGCKTGDIVDCWELPHLRRLKVEALLIRS